MLKGTFLKLGGTRGKVSSAFILAEYFFEHSSLFMKLMHFIYGSLKNRFIDMGCFVINTIMLVFIVQNCILLGGARREGLGL